MNNKKTQKMISNLEKRFGKVVKIVKETSKFKRKLNTRMELSFKNNNYPYANSEGERGVSYQSIDIVIRCNNFEEVHYYYKQIQSNENKKDLLDREMTEEESEARFRNLSSLM